MLLAHYGPLRPWFYGVTRANDGALSVILSTDQPVAGGPNLHIVSCSLVLVRQRRQKAARSSRRRSQRQAAHRGPVQLQALRDVEIKNALPDDVSNALHPPLDSFSVSCMRFFLLKALFPLRNL